MKCFHQIKMVNLMFLFIIGTLSVFADNLSTGEWAWLSTGEPAMIGQTTNDHLFLRNSYNDMGTMLSYDNVVSFKSGKIQSVWVWLDDDEIYLNDKVQAMTPMAINKAGELYNEITYSSLQCDVYLPMSMRLVSVENESYQQGDRMPNGSFLSINEKPGTKVIDGKVYHVYLVMISPSIHSYGPDGFGAHFSSRNASSYKANGALKKDDAPLFGLYIQNDNQDLAEERLDQDMILANIEFNISECLRDNWEPNDYRFIYGTGGNQESQRFQLYNRVALYGSRGFDSEPGCLLATSLSLNQSVASLNVGDTIKLTATVLPEDATNKDVVWASSNPSVATVSTDGLVTALKAGETTIVAKTADGSNLSATCKVVVNNIMAATISLNTSDLELEIDETSQLIATIYPSNATNKAVTWKSSNTSIATVSSNGVVTAKSPGTATITVTTTDGSNLSATCRVTVLERKATSIVLNTYSLSLYVNQTANLTATVYPSDAANKTVTWKSSNTAVATVNDNGLVKAISAGNATVTATTTDGSNLSASCSVKVSIIPVTSISVNQTNLTLDVSETYQLVATILPSNATYQTVTWTSSNSSVARVSDTGLITPVSPGTTTIKAKTTDGTNLTASCQVTVVKRVKSISLNQSSLTLTLPETAQLTAIITPSDATNKVLQWTSSNTGVAKVDNNGFITSVAAGTATIKATTTDGTNLSASCQVTVIKQYVTSITLNESKLVMHLGETAQLIADVEPYNASNKVLSWSSGNTSIARVDNNGLVTAISDGTTYIRATATDGSYIYANCIVEVLPDYYITLDTLSHIRGSSTQIVDLPVTLVNKNLISGIQFDVSLPNDVSFNLIDGVPDVWLDDARKTRSHSISASLLSNGKYRVLVTSSSSKNLKGNDGVLVHMNMLLPQLHNTGNRNIYFSDIIASESDETRHTLNNTSTLAQLYYIVGDADANAFVDIADHAATASKILGKNPSPFYSDAANVDNNYSLDVVDLVGITNIALEIKPISLRQAPIRGGIEEHLFCDMLRLNADDEKQINLGISCGFNFAGFQMDLQLPRGLELVDASLGEDAAELGLVTAIMPDGKIRLLGTSFSDAEIDGICPELLRLRVKADRYYLPGTEIQFSDIVFAERNLTGHNFDGSCIEYVEPSSVYELMEDIRVYVENGNIIVDTPVEGIVQLIAVDGRIVDEYFAQVGHNIYPVDIEGIYIIHFKDKAIKVRL